MKAKEQSIGYTNKLQSTIKSLTRVEGCCKALKPLVPITNSEAIMKLMKFSIGSTIPKSPRYGLLNYTALNDSLPVLHLTSKLKELLKNR